MVAEGKMGSERKMVCSWMKFSTLHPIFELVSTLNSSSQTVWLIYSLWFRSVCSEWYRQCVTISTCIVNSLKLKTISTPEFPETVFSTVSGVCLYNSCHKNFFYLLGAQWLQWNQNDSNRNAQMYSATAGCSATTTETRWYLWSHSYLCQTYLGEKTTRKKHAYMYT